MNASDLVSQEFRMCKHPIPGPNCLTDKAGMCPGPIGSRVLKKSQWYIVNINKLPNLQSGMVYNICLSMLRQSSRPIFHFVQFLHNLHICLSPQRHMWQSAKFSFCSVSISYEEFDVFGRDPKTHKAPLDTSFKDGSFTRRYRFALDIKQRMTW